MRLLLSLGTLAAVIALTLPASPRLATVGAAEPADPLKINSVWQGTMEQSNPKSSYPVILFIKQRNGNAFEGVTLYPTLGNGLLKVTGRIEEGGKLTFSEDSVIHAEKFDQDLICIAGSKYTGELKSGAISGSGELALPGTNEVARLTFSLKSAQ